MKAFADDKMNLAEKLKKFFEQVENIVGKEENAGHQHFLIFPQCFQKRSLSLSSKVGLCGKELKLHNYFDWNFILN